jgi:toxin YoeB
MMIKWVADSWEEYVSFQTDKAMLKRINRLISEIRRSPFEGVGKPEALRHDLTGYWSRRIDDANRLVYRIENETVIIIQCKGHYRPH